MQRFLLPRMSPKDCDGRRSIRKGKVATGNACPYWIVYIIEDPRTPRKIGTQAGQWPQTLALSRKSLRMKGKRI